MSIDFQVQQKIYRLETLRKYQAYYGPNTPYQIVAEINQLEGELRRMLEADLTRPTHSVDKPKSPPKKSKKSAPQKRVSKARPKRKQFSRKKTKSRGFLGLSRATLETIAAIAAIGVFFLFGAVIFAAYSQSTQPDQQPAFSAMDFTLSVQPTLRPTFTPTVDSENSDPPPAEAPPPEGIEVAAVESSGLPSPHKVPTEVPTPVPTLTPRAAPSPTLTPTPVPIDTPLPTNPPPPPAVLPPTATPESPPDTPTPSFRFTVQEQGNREFQKTDYHQITIYVAIVSAGNVPVGGFKVVGDHSPSGQHLESALSDWNWSVTNCLDCDYVKFGNVKFEPGTFSDGVWNIYVADEAGNQLSPVVPLSYSADPSQWVWDFILFSES